MSIYIYYSIVAFVSHMLAERRTAKTHLNIPCGVFYSLRRQRMAQICCVSKFNVFSFSEVLSLQSRLSVVTKRQAEMVFLLQISKTRTRLSKIILCKLSCLSFWAMFNANGFQFLKVSQRRLQRQKTTSSFQLDFHHPIKHSFCKQRSNTSRTLS